MGRRKKPATSAGFFLHQQQLLAFFDVKHKKQRKIFDFK